MSLSNFGTNDLLVKDALTCRWIIETRQIDSSHWWEWTFGKEIVYRTLDECLALLVHPFYERFRPPAVSTRIRNIMTGEIIPAEIFG